MGLLLYYLMFPRSYRDESVPTVQKIRVPTGRAQVGFKSADLLGSTRDIRRVEALTVFFQHVAECRSR